MVSDSLRFPLQGDDALQTIVIGGVLSILGILIIPGIIVQGYLVRVLRAGVRGDSEPPVFDEWGELLLDGIKVIAIQLVYFLVPGFVFFAAIILTSVGIAGAASDSGVLAGVGLLGGLLLLVSLVLFLVATYLLPAGLVNFAHEDDLSAAFDVSTVTSGAFSVPYVVSLVLAVVVSLVLGLVALPLMLLLVGFLVQFYAQVVAFHIVADGFAEGAGLGSHGEEVADIPSADVGT